MTLDADAWLMRRCMAMHAVDPPSRFNCNQAPKAYAWVNPPAVFVAQRNALQEFRPSSILSRGSAMMSDRVVASDASTRRLSWSWPACNIAWHPIDQSSLFGLIGRAARRSHLRVRHY